MNHLWSLSRGGASDKHVVVHHHLNVLKGAVRPGEPVNCFPVAHRIWMIPSVGVGQPAAVVPPAAEGESSAVVPGTVIVKVKGTEALEVCRAVGIGLVTESVPCCGGRVISHDVGLVPKLSTQHLEVVVPGLGTLAVNRAHRDAEACIPLVGSLR